MKKIVVGLMTMMIMSGVSSYAGTGDKSKKQTAKKEVKCSKSDCSKKDCQKNATCPSKPGCVCH